MNEITATIIVAIISGLCVAIPSIIATLSSNKQTNALTTYKIDQLATKVEKHNNVIERVFRLEEKERNLEEKVHHLEEVVERGD